MIRAIAILSACIKRKSVVYLAWRAVYQGKYEEAEPLFRRVLTDSESVVGGENIWYTYGLDTLAGVLSEQVRAEVFSSSTCPHVDDGH